MWVGNGLTSTAFLGQVPVSGCRVELPLNTVNAINQFTSWRRLNHFRYGFHAAVPPANLQALWSHVQSVPPGQGKDAALLAITPGGVAAAFTGAASIAASRPQEGRQVIAALTGAGALSSVVIGAGLLYSSPTGSGALAGNATAVAALLAALSGSGTLAGAVEGGAAVVAALSGSGVLVASVKGIGVVIAALSGAGSTSADAVGVADAATTIVGAGELTSAATADALVAADVDGGGDLAALGALGVLVTADLDGNGELVGSVQGGANVVAALAGSGALSAAGQRGAVVAAVLLGEGELAAAAVGAVNAVAALEGGGDLNAAVYAVGELAATLVGEGVLDADAPIGIGHVFANITEASGDLTVENLSSTALQQIVSALLGAIVANYDDAETVGRVLNNMEAVNDNRIKLNKTTGVLTIYESDGVTVRKTFQIKDANGNPSSTQQYDRIPE